MAFSVQMKKQCDVIIDDDFEHFCLRKSIYIMKYFPNILCKHIFDSGNYLFDHRNKAHFVSLFFTAQKYPNFVFAHNVLFYPGCMKVIRNWRIQYLQLFLRDFITCEIIGEHKIGAHDNVVVFCC